MSRPATGTETADFVPSLRSLAQKGKAPGGRIKEVAEEESEHEAPVIEASAGKLTQVTASIAWAKHPTKCLDVMHSSKDAGSPGMDLHIWDCSPDKDSRDKFILPAPGEQGMIRPVAFQHLCLESKDSLHLEFVECSGPQEPHRMWKLRKGTMRDSHHLHLAEDLGKCLDIPDDVTTNGHKLQLWPCRASASDETLSNFRGIYTPQAAGVNGVDPQNWAKKRIGDESFFISPDPINCVWDTWREWSDCSATCGSGRSSRYRVVGQQPAFDGGECHGDFLENRDCFIQECAKESYLLHSSTAEPTTASWSLPGGVVLAVVIAGLLLLLAIGFLCCAWRLCVRGRRKFQRHEGELVSSAMTTPRIEKEPLIAKPAEDRRITDHTDFRTDFEVRPEPAPKPVCCAKGHPMDKLGLTRDTGWVCDGRSEVGGCRSGIKDFHESHGYNRYRCEKCNYDLCQKCYHQRQAVVRWEQSAPTSAYTGGALFLDDSDVQLRAISPDWGANGFSSPSPRKPDKGDEAESKRKARTRPFPTAGAREG